jgi:hypothetical protein
MMVADLAWNMLLIVEMIEIQVFLKVVVWDQGIPMRRASGPQHKRRLPLCRNGLHFLWEPTIHHGSGAQRLGGVGWGHQAG